MPTYEAHIAKGRLESGLIPVSAVKVHDDGSADAAIFVVDSWCCGVRDADLEAGLDPEEARAQRDDFFPDTEWEPIPPASAKKLVEGAVKFAESCGFAPCREYRKARRIFSGVDAADSRDEFVYGSNGRPCFVPTLEDSEATVARVIAILTAKVGPDNFDFIDPDAPDPEYENARKFLVAFLEKEPRKVPRIHEFSGLITGMLLAPNPLLPSKVHDILWGPRGRTWSDIEEASAFQAALMHYWNNLADRVMLTLEANPGEAVHPMDFDPDFLKNASGPELGKASMLWTRGFMSVTNRWPEAWGEALWRKDLKPHWEYLSWWLKPATARNHARIAAASKETPPRSLTREVAALARKLRTTSEP